MASTLIARASGAAPDLRIADLPEPRWTAPAPPLLFVDRPRLSAALDRGALVPLTVLSAPAGTGKTSLVAAWLAGRTASHRTVWVTFGQATLATGDAWSSVRADLDLCLPGEPLTLVLDGLEGAPDEVADDLATMLHRAGPDWHVVVLTRVDPVLPLHRFRLEGSMVELRMADLAFTDQEAAELLRLSGVELEPESAAVLTRRTRGWAAGVRFAGIYLRDSDDPGQAVHALAGDHGNIAEYLMAEVLATQPTPVRQLLLDTCVVDVLRPGLAEALAGPGAARGLAELAGANVLVEPLAQQPGWYRYHPFLCDLLRAELAARDPERRQRLHRAASRWLDRQGCLPAAVGVAADAGQWPDAAGYVVRALALGEVALGTSDGTLAVQLRRLPDDGPGAADAACCLVRAALAVADDDPVRCAAQLAAARAGAPVSPDGGPDGDPAVEPAFELGLAVLDAAHAALAHDPLALVLVERAERVMARHERHRLNASPALAGLVDLAKGLALVPEGELDEARDCLTAGLRHTRATATEPVVARALGQLAVIEAVQGRLASATELAGRAQSVAARAGGACPVGVPDAELALAWVSTERCELPKAREHLRLLQRAGALPAHGPDPVAPALAAVVRARLLRARADLAGALQTVEAAGEAAPSTSWLARRLRLEAASLQVARGASAAGRSPTDLADLDELQEPQDPGFGVLSGWLRLADGDWAGVRAAATAVLARPDELSVQQALDARLLLVAHDAHRGQPRRAAAALAECLRLARTESVRRPFREAPVQVRQLWADDPRLAAAHPWLGPIEHGATVLPPRQPTSGAAGSGATALTAKETEVLGHVAELLDTEQIADAMFVSVNTVRTHVRNILRKLDVSRRNEAVRRARALGLLDQ